jgi:CheY-specific phosphatase CheX
MSDENRTEKELPRETEKKIKLYFSNISESILFIFKTLLNIDVSPKKLYRKRLTSLPNDIIITIDFNADEIGYFSFFLSLKTAFEICRRLVGGIESQFFDQDHLDIIGELGNMIAGNAIGRLKDVDNSIRLSTPYLSAFHKILASEKLFWTFSCNFNVEIGRLGVLLAIKKLVSAN